MYTLIKCLSGKKVLVENFLIERVNMEYNLGRGKSNSYYRIFTSYGRVFNVSYQEASRVERKLLSSFNNVIKQCEAEKRGYELELALDINF
jgi:hypothetical protein